MGVDLVGACIFCASILLSPGFAPDRGITAELVGSYSTVQRKTDLLGGASDLANVTPKFVLAGIRGARPAEEDLGAGTPAREWRIRLALGPSHDEQAQKPEPPGGVTSSQGTGRYENAAVLYRLPVGRRDSLEAAYTHRGERSTDGVDLGQATYVLSEQRLLTVERDDWAIGWRHRWRGLEVALAWRYSFTAAQNFTALSSSDYDGRLAGGTADVRYRSGRWTLEAYGEALGGHATGTERFAPDFGVHDNRATARFTSAAFEATYSTPSVDLRVSYAYDRNRLPFVAFGVLGAETDAFDSGFRARSRVALNTAGLDVRARAAEGLRVALLLRATLGNETVTLSDSRGVLPDRILRVRWAESPRNRGSFGIGETPAFVVGFGVELAVGRPGR